MTILDAYAVIALLRDEPARAEVEELLRAQDPGPRMSTANLGESIDRLMRVWGHAFEDVLDRLMWLSADGLEIVDIDLEIGAVGGFLRATYYNRREKDISIADCTALATALVLEDSIATADPGLAATAREEGVDVIALPDSNGVRP